MDYDIISNISLVGNNTNNANHAASDWFIHPHEVVFTIISIISVAADSLIIHTIRKNEMLKTPTNIFVLNIAVLDIIYLICLPANWMSPFHEFLFRIYCFTNEVEIVFQCSTIILLTTLSISYALSIYGKIIAGVWMFVGTNLLICAIYCINDGSSPFPVLMILLSFIILLFTHVTCGVKKYRSTYDEDYKYRFVLISVYLGCWTINWLCTFVSFIDSTSVTLFRIYLFSAALGYLYAVANAFALALLDKRFRLIFLQTIRCSDNKYVNVHFEDDRYKEAGIVEVNLYKDMNVFST